MYKPVTTWPLRFELPHGTMCHHNGWSEGMVLFRLQVENPPPGLLIWAPPNNIHNVDAATVLARYIKQLERQ